MTCSLQPGAPIWGPWSRSGAGSIDAIVSNPTPGLSRFGVSGQRARQAPSPSSPCRPGRFRCARYGPGPEPDRSGGIEVQVTWPVAGSIRVAHRGRRRRRRSRPSRPARGWPGHRRDHHGGAARAARRPSCASCRRQDGVTCRSTPSVVVVFSEPIDPGSIIGVIAGAFAPPAAAVMPGSGGVTTRRYDGDAGTPADRWPLRPSTRCGDGRSPGPGRRRTRGRGALQLQDRVSDGARGDRGLRSLRDAVEAHQFLVPGRGSGPGRRSQWHLMATSDSRSRNRGVESPASVPTGSLRGSLTPRERPARGATKVGLHSTSRLVSVDLGNRPSASPRARKCIPESPSTAT